jgi:hypothetical protein
MGYMRYRTPLAWLTPDARIGGPSDELALDDHMSDLAECFPCLVGKPGVRPWMPARLDEWANECGATATELYATRFVLHVWDGKHPWKCGRFDLLDALDFWDETHRTAFISWVLDPWWPLSLRLARGHLPDTLRDMQRRDDPRRDTLLQDDPRRDTPLLPE